jgi:hypothetical protein
MGTDGPVQGNDILDASRLLTAEDRARMLSRIHSLVYWVGMLVPEQELLGDSNVDLRETVFKLTTKDSLTSEDREAADELVRLLRAKERELEKKLAHDPMTVDTANGLLEEICGLLKAMDDLRAAESPDAAQVRKRELMARIEDAKRWQKFVEEIRPGSPA